MTLPSSRVRRPDDWPSSHVRARADLSEQLDGALDPTEAEWLETHLAACEACTVTATAYAAQRLELRALRDRTPEPPRDLWARTAAAIESEARFRETSRRRLGRRRSALAPFALLSSAVAVAVIVGTLTSSQRTGGDGTASPTPQVAVASDLGGSAPSVVPGATPLAVAQRVEWLSRESDGAYRFRVANVDEVCPPEAVEPCDTAAPVEDRQVALDRNLSSVFGSEHSDALIVFNNPDVGDPGTVNVVPLDESVAPSPSPTTTPAASPAVVVSSAPSLAPSSTATSTATSTASPSSTPRPPATSPPASPTPSAPIESASPTPTPTATATLEPSPSPSVAVSPSPATGAVEIARDVVLVGQSASYSPDGAWFAFTARPADGSLGPDIYLWKVGDALATPVTADHRSTFGSWAGVSVVGSTVLETTLGSGETATTELTPRSFLLDPLTQATTDLPAAGRAWRPAVDPSGRKAVYWAGTLRATVAPGFAPEAGRLVLGTWTPDAIAVDTSSQSPLASAITDKQARAHDEVTIAAGRMEDWEARWDMSGTHLAVWIADAQDPRVGRLSLYGVSGFDGRIDLRKPLLDAELATAGFAISEGKLVWATPSADGAVTGDKIQVLAWTENGQGQVESVSGPVVVIR
ncbi:MAG: zf-HC2 domain-containing protein [Chloroflexi bacterium]|nr:zf-HC2 domain-containing protein [Chloroflexota bacterium]